MRHQRGRGILTRFALAGESLAKYRNRPAPAEAAPVSATKIDEAHEPSGVAEPRDEDHTIAAPFESVTVEPEEINESRAELENEQHAPVEEVSPKVKEVSGTEERGTGDYNFSPGQGVIEEEEISEEEHDASPLPEHFEDAEYEDLEEQTLDVADHREEEVIAAGEGIAAALAESREQTKSDGYMAEVEQEETEEEGPGHAQTDGQRPNAEGPVRGIVMERKPARGIHEVRTFGTDIRQTLTRKWAAFRRSEGAAPTNPNCHRLGRRHNLAQIDAHIRTEGAGSHRIHHMHGSLFQSRCTHCNQPFPDQSFHESANLPTCKTCASPIRPHIVWFGEIPLDMDAIYRELNRATTLLVVGTSGSVYPAAGFVNIANQRRIRTIYVGPEEPLNIEAFDEVILSPATEALPRLIE